MSITELVLFVALVSIFAFFLSFFYTALILRAVSGPQQDGRPFKYGGALASTPFKHATDLGAFSFSGI